MDPEVRRSLRLKEKTDCFRYIRNNKDNIPPTISPKVIKKIREEFCKVASETIDAKSVCVSRGQNRPIQKPSKLRKRRMEKQRAWKTKTRKKEARDQSAQLMCSINMLSLQSFCRCFGNSCFWVLFMKFDKW